MGKSRRYRIVFYKGVAVATVLLFLFSCSKDDDYQYPSVKTDFVSITTNAEGRVDSLFDDDGGKYAVSLSQTDLAKDSLYRCVSKYAVDDIGIHLYTLQTIVSPDPVVYKSLKTDPVTSIRVWKGGGYINMVVKTLGQSKAHKWGLHEDAASVKDGKRRLYFILYHDKNGDYEAFSRETYLSFPLRKYMSTLEKGDSLFVSVHQTIKDKEAVVVYPLAY